MKKDLTIIDIQKYLKEHYNNFPNVSNYRMLTKLFEEVGEVAEAIAIKEGFKRPKENVDLASELADVIHYTVALANLNNINLSEIILEKDKEASKRYNHNSNLYDFINKK
ncbi:MazG nucleotide pyrophosphohydrolase domain-containing protein [Mycoplasma leonicaptivi]|uniref:MazG nucleotide pyrophosphohydrolase domain-containing protein n=1 Tax=Mycoplasma leonicaptivi TaxID=36742 RepID=UPI000482E4D3|nr:MazG nucleotide pyrophosphohydrolase domain-containing protein [Mycoplasma leonicaptivi]